MLRPKTMMIMGLILSFTLLGCRSMKDDLKPIHDEIFIFELPFDLTYLRTLEALENVDGWELSDTEKEKGIIRVRNVAYSRLDDADKRIATIVIKRLKRKQTSVALAEPSQRVRGGDELLRQINEFVRAEL